MTTGFPTMGSMPGFGPTPTMGGWPGYGPTMGGWPGYGPTMGGTMTVPYGTMHCPVCGYSGSVWHGGVSPSLALGGYTPYAFGGLGGLRRFGGSFSPQFMTTGLPTDEEIEEMVYDTFDVDTLIPWDTEIDVESSAGVVTLRGEVPNKTVKHAAGDDVWWVPGVDDVRNELIVTGRRRVRGARAPMAVGAAAPTLSAPPTRRPTPTRAAVPAAARGRPGVTPTRPTRTRGGTTTTGGTSQTT
ncbi:MAG: BON domain-containing protein [Chloroflexi bacterium]|nr:BON domain-containing protein [Chloroflexota bacterium]